MSPAAPDPALPGASMRRTVSPFPSRTTKVPPDTGGRRERSTTRRSPGCNPGGAVRDSPGQCHDAKMLAGGPGPVRQQPGRQAPEDRILVRPVFGQRLERDLRDRHGAVIGLLLRKPVRGRRAASVHGTLRHDDRAPMPGT